MTDEQLLIRAICAHPEEDTPRLAYADWCDDNGHGWHAELIRLQCGGASNQKMAGYRRRWYKRPEVVAEMRAAFLVNERFRYGIGDLDRVGPGASGPWGRVDRGFLSAVCCTLAEFLANLDDIVRRHPVQQVRPWDRFPTLRYVSGDINRPNEGLVHGFFREGELNELGQRPPTQYTLPAELFDRLPPSDHPAGIAGAYTGGWPASEALNVACLKLGHERRAQLWAGLHPRASESACAQM